MDIKYNIYYSSYANGPWTLANDTPVDHVDEEMSFFIPDLDPNTRYYITVIGGYIENGEFIRLESQPIGPNNIGANALLTNVGGGVSAPPSVEIVTNSPKISTEGSLMHVFAVV